MTTSNMPATASTIAKGIVCKTGPGVQYNGIAKVWGGGDSGHSRPVLARRPRGPAHHHGVNLYADYDVVRPAGYLQVEFKTS